ncbi:hypothetical protein [Dyadobacter sp. 676]|uniref:Uncharacterized protein n=1 Tax=Dyadobacter sp. 676 TaxID=3088362 RepID=A0AAU8FJ23_9BACT
MVVAKGVSQQALYGKAGLSLLGQTVGNLLKGEMKIDFVGLAADLSLTTGASSLTGAVGEMGVDLSEGTFYSTINSPQEGGFKLATGLGFGTFGGKASEMMSVNGFSKAMSGMVEGMVEVYNQVIDTMASKIQTPNK